MTIHGLRTWLIELQEASTACLDARNCGLSFSDASDQLADAFRKADKAYWDLLIAQTAVEDAIRDGSD